MFTTRISPVIGSRNSASRKSAETSSSPPLMKRASGTAASVSIPHIGLAPKKAVAPRFLIEAAVAEARIDGQRPAGQQTLGLGGDEGIAQGGRQSFLVEGNQRARGIAADAIDVVEGELFPEGIDLGGCRPCPQRRSERYFAARKDKPCRIALQLARSGASEALRFADDVGDQALPRRLARTLGTSRHLDPVDRVRRDAAEKIFEPA